MFRDLQRVFELPELRQKIIFTLLMLVVCRIGAFVPVPGINSEVALAYFRQFTGGGQNLFQLVGMFTGGAFSQMTVIALGVMPYISASIIMQLVTALIPSLQREMAENPTAGRRKVTRYTRVLTLVLSFFQALAMARFAVQINRSSPGMIVSELVDPQSMATPWLFYVIVIVTMTTGTTVLMWIGEQITERGIGNGVSLIITIGILSQLPMTLGMIWSQLNLDSQEPGQMSFSYVLVLLSLFVLVTVGTILVTQGQRRIPLQYARRVVGRKEVQGGTSYLPLKVNYAGVIPVIFASSMLMFPSTIARMLGQGNWLGELASYFDPRSTTYTLVYVALIIAFTYFWTAMQFRPDQIASELKKNGAFIPGIRQGKPTQDYLEAAMNRITVIGALFLALIAVLPQFISRFLGVSQSISYFFGGTSLLILVGVVLDTMKQVEGHLIQKRYDGFMRRGRVKGR
jgi:preprotein translocase subunit SecY